MDIFIEPLILYAVLFFRISSGTGSSGELTPPVEGAPPMETAPPMEAAPLVEAIDFSLSAEIARIMLYNIPSLALIWYLLLKVKSLKEWGIGLPGKKDLIPAALTLPALTLIGLSIAIVSRYFNESPPRFLPPRSIFSWGILALSCLSTAYLEESFFRFYLLSKREAMGLGPHRAALISTLLFSFCHMYEGPWGFLNAALSGLLLAFMFIRFRSLHGIAFAHAMYNVLVYALNSG